MFINKIEVSNFKAIRNISVELGRINVVVGENSAGKSSLLQAIHLACRCAANKKVLNNQSRSIAVTDLDYFPTLDLQRIGNEGDLREKRGGSPEIFLKVKLFCTDGEVNHSATIPVRRGRNNAVQVDLKSSTVDKELYLLLNDKEKPFTSYIPGLAGISSAEEKRSLLPIIRQAASGDANVVLRNIIYLIREKELLPKLENLASDVLGCIKLRVNFVEGDDFFINVDIQTNSMNENRWAPLDLAGTGVLQIIQIFSYIVLFSPRLLLIDEPDSHLHSSKQGQLVHSLEKAAEEFGSQVIMTTHSPSLVRACSENVNFIWMKSGSVCENPQEARNMMKWGLLDKKILIITEDTNTSLLESILSQWSDKEKITAIWPVNGVQSLPNAEGAAALRSITGLEKIVIHRDGDFFTKLERQRYLENYAVDGVTLWFTEHSDIEAYLCSREVVASQLELNESQAMDVINYVIEDNRRYFDRKFIDKRKSINGNNNLYPNMAGTPSSDEARDQLGDFPAATICGKELHKKIKVFAQNCGINGGEMSRIPEDIEVAIDLFNIL